MTHAHPYLRHPVTGAPLTALGTTKSGRLIWPVMGGSQPTGEPTPPAPAGVPPASGPAPSQTLTVPASPSGGAIFPPPNTGTPAAPPAQQPAPGGPAQPQPPANPGTPWRELPIEDQVEYWRTQSRRHENRQLDALGLAPGELERLRATAADHQRVVAANQTEQQRAISEAEQRGRSAAIAEVGGQLVDAHMRVAIGARMTPDQVTALLGSLNLAQFQTAEGRVDADRVATFVSTILPAAPAAPVTPPEVVPAAPVPAVTAGVPGAPVTGVPQRQVPDMGQGPHPVTRPSGLEAGREIARQRFASQAPPPVQQQPQQ